MTILKKALFISLLIIIGAACKHKKKVSVAGDDPIEVSDLIGYFKPVSLPYQYTDTALLKKDKDSLLVSYANFTRFVPDSILTPLYGKNKKIKIYALGRIDIAKAGTYLLVKTVFNEKRAFQVVYFDNDDKFAAALNGLSPDNNKATIQSVSIDKRYAITKTVAIKNADGSFSEGKDVYALDPTKKGFALVMTDALNDKVTELINPIDTFPRKAKYTADYTNGKMNMVSIRDGRRAGQLSFFVHFEKNNGECTGELKGEARMISANSAEYHVDGDPCVLKFIFTSSAVTLQEEEGCGNRRGLNCSFNGSYAKKKYVSPTAAKKTSKKK